MKKTNLIIIISVLALIGFLVVVYKLTSQPSFYPEMTQVLPTDHTKWSSLRDNVFVEYSDFQCPACQNFHAFLKKELDTDPAITKKIIFVFRNYPLYQIHENAFELAYAAEAAGKQGKFFEMSDLLFTQKKPVLELASALKLNLDQFKKDMSSKEIKDKVDADLSSGDKAGINATPTFFLNGKKLEISSYDELKSILKSTP